MNSQELRALQEAYSQVYELDEEKVELKQRNKNEMQRKAGNLGREVVSSKKGPKRTAAMNRMGKLVSSIARDDEEKRFKTLGQSPAHNEQVDLYDIILSHLLDEGFADTNEAALAIMTNMSEDWRESIVEGAAQNVANRAQKLANQRKGQTPERKATYQNLANKADERANPKKEADWRTGISDSSRKMNVSTYADRDEVKIKTTNPKKLRKQKAMGEH